MNWSPQQDAALLAVHKWITEEPEKQVFRLFGYAGTGKTTLAKHFAEGLDGRVVFGAFTGKAAYVLQSKGCIGATTIHKLIYIPRSMSKANLIKLEDELRALQALPPDPEESDNPNRHPKRIEELIKAIQDERQNIERPMFTLNLDSCLCEDSVELVIIDECSMVDEAIGKDLESFGKKILVLGDPAQLPPVRGTGYFTDCKPDFMLTEIHRQAKDNPIIALATEVRLGKVPALGTYGTSLVLPKRALNRELVLAAGQVLVGKNQTRRDFNDRFREVKERKTKYPEEGDKLVCLRNNHELGLLNGGIWHVQEAQPPDGDRVPLTLKEELDGAIAQVVAHRGIFVGEEIPWWDKRDAEEFDYGYALTVHKSQGSQWNDVLIFDESFVFREHRAKWLYTAITRAAERVTLMMVD
jgi:exodeoxyribonuclease-5